MTARAPGEDGRGGSRGGRRAVGYVGAGHCRVSSPSKTSAFYFMEMTHAACRWSTQVTEAITGQDLVEGKLRVGRRRAPAAR